MKNIVYVFLMMFTLINSAFSATSDTGKTLGIFQTVGLPEDNYIQSFKGSLGVTKVTKEGGLVTTADDKFDPSDGISSIPYVGYLMATPPKQSDLLTYAKAVQNAQRAGLITQMTDYMKRKGAVEGVYYYRQLVKVMGNPNEKAIIWHLLIDATGRARFSDAKIVPSIPTYIHHVYTPLKVEEGLPATWAYPDAGYRTYQSVDKLMNTLTLPVTEDALGQWDMPVAQEKPYSLPYPNGCELDDVGDMICDPDWMLKCIIDHTADAACPNPVDDIKTLMDARGSDGAYLDYVRTLTPVYDQVLSGYDAEGLEEYEDIARVSISVDERTWIPGKVFFFISPTGGAKFHMKARVGYELQKKVDRYFVEQDGTYTHVGSEVSQTISPTINVDKTVSVTPSGARCPSYNFNIIDPFTTDEIYDWRYDTVNEIPDTKYIYVAPLNCY